MQSDSDFGTFFLPGPTEVRQKVLQAMLKRTLAWDLAGDERLLQKFRCVETSALGLDPSVRDTTGGTVADERLARPARAG